MIPLHTHRRLQIVGLVLVGALQIVLGWQGSSGGPQKGRRSLANDEGAPLSRRDTLQAASFFLATSSSSSWISPAHAVVSSQTNERQSFGASWSAVDGLNTNDGQVVAFDATAYRAMRDDPTRTPFFRKAIVQRLGKENPESQVVLDLGTGPFALFALIAAQEGAGKVYAVEANPAAAASARRCVKQAGFDDVVTIVEGYSIDIQLPEPVDFIVAEIIGSIASEEGVYATVKDAHRFLKQPTDPRNWIPCRVQTYTAPASYSLHNLFGPPEFDWTRLKDPVRFSCRDKGLELLSDPQLIEDISLDQLTGGGSSSSQSTTTMRKDLTFVVDADRLPENERALRDEFLRDQKSNPTEAQELAKQTATSFSGLALWPRLILNDQIVIDSRHYVDGAHQKSHWQTVLPITSGRPIGPLKGGETIRATYHFQLPVRVTQSPVYDIKGELTYY